MDTLWRFVRSTLVLLALGFLGGLLRSSTGQDPIAPLIRDPYAVTAELGYAWLNAIEAALPSASVTDTLCNDRGSALSVVAEYQQGGQWVEEGWYNVEPYGCRSMTFAGTMVYLGDASGARFDARLETIVRCAPQTAFTYADDSRQCAPYEARITLTQFAGNMTIRWN
jgi:uncharacterized membrane protein